MKDSSIAGSKPNVADREDVAASNPSNQCMEYQAMTDEMDIYTYVVISPDVADTFSPTGNPKVVLHENWNDWISNTCSTASFRNSPLYGIYVSCTAEEQDKKGYRMIKRDCGKPQDYTHLGEMSIKMQKALQVPSIVNDSWIKVGDADDLRQYDFPEWSQDLVYIDVFLCTNPDFADVTAEQIYEKFELLYEALKCERGQEYVDANLSVVFCLPPETSIEVIRLLCSYFDETL